MDLYDAYGAANVQKHRGLVDIYYGDADHRWGPQQFTNTSPPPSSMLSTRGTVGMHTLATANNDNGPFSSPSPSSNPQLNPYPMTMPWITLKGNTIVLRKDFFLGAIIIILIILVLIDLFTR